MLRQQRGFHPMTLPWRSYLSVNYNSDSALSYWKSYWTSVVWQTNIFLRKRLFWPVCKTAISLLESWIIFCHCYKVIRAQTSCSFLAFTDCYFPLFTLKLCNSILLKILMIVSYFCYAHWISSSLSLDQPFRWGEGLTRFVVQISFI